MGTGYNSLIIALEENIEKLKALNLNLKQEKEELQKELDKKKHDLMVAHKEILDTQSKYNSLRIAESFSKNSQEREYTEERISKLVREINKCIALLNQQ